MRRTPADLRRENVARALGILHERGPVTRKELTDRLGVSRATAGLVVDWLCTEGLAETESPAPGGARGRPSPIVRPRAGAALAHVAQIAADSTRIATVELGGVLQELPATAPARSAPDETIAALGEELRGRLRRAARRGVRYQAVAIGCGGVTRREDGFVHHAPNLGWRDVPLRDELLGRLGSRVVRRPGRLSVANDADLGALAEHRRGAGRGSPLLLYLHAGIGLGGGIVKDGRQLGGYGGEVGHMVVDPNGRKCRCGAVGCWENVVDERALLRAAGRSRVAAPAVPGQVGRILEAARGGDRTATAAVAATARALGSGLASLVNVIGPERIVLGGYLADLAPLAPEVLRHELQRVLSPEARSVPVVAGECGEHAVLAGAAEVAFAPLLEDPPAALASAAAGR